MPEREMESSHMRLRPPRVHITYEVEQDDSIHQVELPFVIGVLADLVGQGEEPPPRMSDRKFVQVDRDNFDAVLAAYAPRLVFPVKNHLAPGDAPLNVELRFRSIADFEPESLARQVPGLFEALTAARPEASAQMDEILHAPAFQRLEASWRGLKYLVMSSNTSSTLKILVISATKQELLMNLREAPSPEQTAFARKVLEEPYRLFRGEPFAVLVGDYEFSNGAEDLELLEGMAVIASSAHAPFIAAASPRMFGWDDFSQLSLTRRLSEIFEGIAYARWRSFRQRDEAAYVALVMPRILLRMLFSEDTWHAKAFPYRETVDKNLHNNFLWGNAAFALAARLAEAFSLYAWCAAITGLEGGGLVNNLPTIIFEDPNDDVRVKGPVEIPVDEVREMDLADSGFNCLVQYKDTGAAVFFAATSCIKPARYSNSDATQAARMAARLPYGLAVSRFAHYLKCILRDKLGDPPSREFCEQILNHWISGYVMSEDSATEDRKAMFPLHDARIEVSEVPGCPGQFRAIAFLRPHYQVQDINLSLRVIVTLPAPVRAGSPEAS
jgi:type VI secretion system protein ImpC